MVVVASTAALSGCGSSTAKGELANIENQVSLPAHARPLSAYSRYYARAGDGTIWGVYVIHEKGYAKQVAEFCRRLPDKPFPCPVNGGRVRLVTAGQHVWAPSVEDLPGMSGGGCLQVTVHFNPRKNSFDRVECNGPY